MSCKYAEGGSCYPRLREQWCGTWFVGLLVCLFVCVLFLLLGLACFRDRHFGDLELCKGVASITLYTKS